MQPHAVHKSKTLVDNILFNMSSVARMIMTKLAEKIGAFFSLVMLDQTKDPSARVLSIQTGTGNGQRTSLNATCKHQISDKAGTLSMQKFKSFCSNIL